MRILIVILALSSFAFAKMTKTELVKDGKTYIEEITTDESGTVTKIAVYPKPGQGKTTTTQKKDAKGNVTTTTVHKSPGFNSTVSIEQSKEEAEASAKATEELTGAIASCTPLKRSTPHPMAQNQSISMEVHGLEGAKCKFTQQSTGVFVNCLFTEAQRQEFKSKKMSALQKHLMDPKVCTVSH